MRKDRRRHPRHDELRLRHPRPPEDPHLSRRPIPRLRLRPTGEPYEAHRPRRRHQPRRQLQLRRAEPPRHRDGPSGSDLHPRLRPERQSRDARPPERRPDGLRLRPPESPHEPRDTPADRRGRQHHRRLHLLGLRRTLAHTGSDSQPYAFTGEPLDPNSGFQYHRARWLDPRTGRFLAMDPFSGSDSDPATLHRYLYAGADPAGKFDPTGKFQTTALAVGGVLAVLAGLSFVACAPLRPPKTAGLYWKASPPADEAQETKRAALTVARTGIRSPGVSLPRAPRLTTACRSSPSPGANRCRPRLVTPCAQRVALRSSISG